MIALSSDILHGIFQFVCDQLRDESGGPDAGMGYPVLQFSYIHSVQREFAKLRRVCRSWKAVSDPFLFKEFSFSISPSPWHYSEFNRVYGALFKKKPPASSRPWTVRNPRREQKL